MTCSAKAIICDEIFDENSLPSEQEICEYAVRIGINPDTEKHLLPIALDGLMSPLPEDWKPCLDERIKRIYYYNAKSHQTQWTHPLDEHFENLVKKKRQEESISAGDDDSKTSVKEDLKSFEEAITTSEMNSSRIVSESHKSRLSSVLQSGQNKLKDLSPDGRKVLGPLGRPPLPPKRRASPASPKQGNLSLRLSPSPSASRIDIDSIGVPLGAPSPEVKVEKHQPARSPAFKLTGGGSAFLKSNQKQAASPSEETKPIREDPSVDSVKDVENFGSEDLDDKVKSIEDRKLKHSASLGESGFDKLTKSKRFASLQESLMSLKNEMELTAKSPSSPSAPLALRGILREKPSPTAKLWDVDPLLLTNEEKEKLRIQEMKDERKQNVRFADIINKPINIQFSKSDSEDETNTNDSSNDLDDFILETTGFDDEMKDDNKESEKFQKRFATDEEDYSKTDKVSKSNSALLSKKEPNKNLVSRLTDLNVDSERSFQENKKKRITEMENNNSEDDVWLTDTEDLLNQNQRKTKDNSRKTVFDNTKLELDIENNSIEKQTSISENKNLKPHKKKEILKVQDKSQSPTKITQFLDIFDKELYATNPVLDDNSIHMAIRSMDAHNIDSSTNDKTDIGLAGVLRKSKLMPEMDLEKVFESLRDSIINSSEHSESSDVGEGEEMQTSPIAEEKQQPKEGENSKAVRKLVQHQQRNLKDKKKALEIEFEENVDQIQRELQRQESIERQRFYMEVQQSVTKYKEELEIEKNERESQLRTQCEEYLKELEIILNKEKDTRVKKLKEDCDNYFKEQEKKTSNEKAAIEEEMKRKIENSSLELERIVADHKQKEEQEIMRLTDESKKTIEEVRQRIELEQLDQEKTFKEELLIVHADYERTLAEKREEVEKLKSEQEAELFSMRSQHEESVRLMREQHIQTVRQLQEQFHQEEQTLRKKHVEKMEILNAQLNRSSEKEDITLLNREFEKVRCEKRLLEDKYKSLKEKYLRLKNEVRLSLERKRQAKLNRQLQQREPASTAEDSTERSTDHGKPPLARKKLTTTLSSDETTGERENAVGTPKTIKRRPKPQAPVSTSSATVDSNLQPPAKPKNVRNPSPQQRREGVSSAEDNHTSVSEEIQTEQDDYAENWTQSALSPLENLRKQLEKLDDLEEKFPTSVHADTYLRYPFSRPGVSCELEFYRHRLHLERESVRRAKEALSEQRMKIENKQLQLRHRQHTDTMHQLHQEERELTDMEVSLHRTRALLGEKIIRLRHLEQSIERAATFTSNHDTTTTVNTDSSGFSGSDLDLSHAGQHLGEKSDAIWTDSVLQSLEHINSEIREIWTILGKKQVPGMGPPPMLNYESRAINQGGADPYNLAPHRATDIAERTRRLKEWLIRTKDQQVHMVAPVIL